MVSLTCPAEHGRPYQFDQPNASTLLAVEPQSAPDNDLKVAIENEGAGTTNNVTIPAGSTDPVSTTAPFANIDAAEVRDANGDVIDGDGGRDYAPNLAVAVNDGDETSPTVGEWLGVLWGSGEYGNTYGDPGIPTLGTGSHGNLPSTPSGSLPFYHPNNMSLERPVGSSFEDVGGVQSMEVSFGNNVERTPTGGREQTNLHGMFAPEGSVTASGETIQQAMSHEQATGVGETTRVTFNRTDDEYIDLVNAVVTETDLESAAGENSPDSEFTLMPQKAEDGGRALEISSAGGGA
jgi:hypothetical protein